MIGSKHTNILSATVIDQQIECLFGGSPIIGQFQQLYSIMDATVGTDGASLFSLPAAGFSKARQANMITWYTDQVGVFRAFEALSLEERTSAERLLRSILSSAASKGSFEEKAMLSVALNVTSAEDILYNGESVVLSNWGLLPAEGASFSGSPLSPYLPDGFDLVREAGEGGAGSGTDATLNTATLVSASDTGATTAEPKSSQNDNIALAAVPNPIVPLVLSNRGFRQAGLWLSALALLLALFLLYLLWPGNLLYPGQSAATTPGMQSANRQAADTARDQITRLRNALSGNLCTAQNLEELDGVAGLPLLPSAPRPQTSLPFGVIPPDPAPNSSPIRGTADPSPARPQTLIPGGTPRTGLRGADLIDKLENGVVMIVGLTGDGVSIGSGFLVSPTQVVTNDHVIADVGNRKIYVSNKHLAQPVSATITARTSNSNGSDQDFAVLQLERPVEFPRLTFSAQAGRLDSVVAAGYPKFVSETDPAFSLAIEQGNFDRLNSLQLAMTRGEITAVQEEPSGISIVAHSATISPGNSGGPLVDRCGRVVGINTFTRSDSESALHLNYALSSRDIIKFLGEHGVGISSDTGACSNDEPPSSQAAIPTPPPSLPAPTLPAPSTGQGTVAPPVSGAAPSVSGAAPQ